MFVLCMRRQHALGVCRNRNSKNKFYFLSVSVFVSLSLLFVYTMHTHMRSGSQWVSNGQWKLVLFTHLRQSVSTIFTWDLDHEPFLTTRKLDSQWVTLMILMRDPRITLPPNHPKKWLTILGLGYQLFWEIPIFRWVSYGKSPPWSPLNTAGASRPYFQKEHDKANA